MFGSSNLLASLSNLVASTAFVSNVEYRKKRALQRFATQILNIASTGSQHRESQHRQGILAERLEKSGVKDTLRILPGILTP
jgi:hypothetical protein